MRSVHPETRSKYDLLYDPLIGGKTGTIRKSLQRLEKRGLIEFVEETKEGKKYKAILARGEAVDTVTPILNDTDTNTSGSGHTNGTVEGCPTDELFANHEDWAFVEDGTQEA